MRTVSTLCACGAGIGLASVGLTVICEESSNNTHLRSRTLPSRDLSSPSLEMTAVASYPQHHVRPSFAPSTPQSARSASEYYNEKARPGKAKVGQKRTLDPHASFSLGGVERFQEPEQDPVVDTQVETPNARSRSWLRRLSSSMLAPSRESTPISRPGSAAISHSNGSLTFPHSGSTTPIFSSSSSGVLPPNKLVKRASSVRSTNSSPFRNSTSKLPVPVFSRPATSHDRIISLQETPSGTSQSDRMSIDEDLSHARDSPRRQFFTPKVAAGAWLAARRRSFSGIPQPIKRVYPDRNYTPILVAASNNMTQAEAEVEDGFTSDEEALAAQTRQGAIQTLSSPLPDRVLETPEGEHGRRSFSFGNLITPQPLWKRPSHSNKSRSSGSKLLRRGRSSRIVSAPQATMGNTFSHGHDSERPAKRRDLTDHQPALRNFSNISSNEKQSETRAHKEIELHLGGDTPQSIQSQSPISQYRPAPAFYQASPRPVRVSAAQSEVTSTVDSDSEYRSVGDDSTDYQSDAVYDSYPTRTTRSSSGRRRPHVEKIFDESPPTFSSAGSTKLKDLLNDAGMTDNVYVGSYRHSTIEEEESNISTPVRSQRGTSVTSTPSVRPGAQQSFQSSPPVISSVDEVEEIDWDAFDTEMEGTQDDSQMLETKNTPHQLAYENGLGLRHLHLADSDMTPSGQNGGISDRNNIFDWSEANPSPNASYSPQRPQTMHTGRTVPDSRGSRSTGRRAPSGMHARSHSVPVVPDAGGRRSNVVANRFGTWGVGSKAVTEDWGEDFELDDQDVLPEVSLEEDAQRVDSGHGMFVVPRSIREQQQNVVANIGLLREWGLLIEELKELRLRAVTLGMMEGPYANDWQEVDAMIDLADQETEEETLEPRRTPPSSPNFDYGAFDESTSTSLHGHSARRTDMTMLEHEPTTDFARPSPHAESAYSPFTSRTRKDSEAVARSVIEALQSKRSVSDPTTPSSARPSKKVPFDTATLRHIVPYVDRLKRRVKDGLRETEGLHTSPQRPQRVHEDDSWDEAPPFGSIFNEPGPSDTQNDGIFRRRSRREDAATDHDGTGGPVLDQRADLAYRMQSMNLPQ